jgi:hydroxypyruvate isomerase
MSHSLRYLANCSMLFTELPLLQRPEAARSAGFGAVEFWWPFEDPVPGDAAVDAFVSAVGDAGVRLVGLNFFAGDLAGPDAGVLSIPARSQQFRDNIDVTVGIGERLGASGFNALYGVRVDGVPEQEQDELALSNIVDAARAAASIGATVFIEPVSGPKPYPLRRAADAAAVVDRARATGAGNVGILFDVYHLASNGDDVDRTIAAYAGRVAHVQIADAPGRGEPGTGKLDLDGYLSRLEQAGYAGWVGLEYKPTVPTVDSLAWLPRERRAGAEASGAGAEASGASAAGGGAGQAGGRAGSSREGSAP